ncbi:MAG: hypothetical protein NTZ44_00660 [Candidatus Nomurabacteria bacterium]|nr:hypothetical protein [Candidatus Nomurabacteria bacterium]
MNLGELANRLTTDAKVFRNKKLITEVLPKVNGQEITEENVKKFINEFLTQVKLPADVRDVIDLKLGDYSKRALNSIRRNNHMNDYESGNTFNQISAEAILVDFINYACMPLDLGFYTKDLLEKVPA